MLENRFSAAVRTLPHPIWDHWARPSPRIVRNPVWADAERYPRPVVYAVNSDGCRHPEEVARPKPAGRRRVLVLGDSFTLGFYEEDSVAGRLRRFLNGPQGARFEVINCATASFSPLLYYLRLRHQLLALDPDEIVLNLDLTDVYDDYRRYRPLYRFSRDGEPLEMRAGAQLVRRLTAWALDWSYVSRVLYGYRLQVLRGAAGAAAAGGSTAPRSDADLFAYHAGLPVESGEWRRAVEFTLGNVGRILSLCRQRGIAVTVTTYPHRQQLEPDAAGRVWHREFEYRTAALCRERGAAFYSAFDAVAAAFRAGRHVYLMGDMHFSPEGQAVWSGGLAAQVGPEILRRAGRPAASTP